MKKLLNFIKSKILMFILALLLPLSATGVVLTYAGTAHAATSSLNYNESYVSQVTLTNGNFSSGTSTDSLSTSLSGWSGQKPSSSATAGIINVGTSFSGSRYYLEENPLAKASDKKILMINSRTANSGDYPVSQQGYKSSAISLAVNAFYRFQVSFKSDTYKNETTYGSIYLTGLTDDNGNDVKAEFNRVSANDWVTYSFFLATGNISQTVNIELWLGGRELDNKSSGVVFFDDCTLFQYSENAFWNQYNNNADNSYTLGSTTYHTTNFTDLRTNNALDFDGYNFDFEDGIYTNTAEPVSKWHKTGTGNARVFNVSAPEAFKQATDGYEFVGSDLSCKVVLDEQQKIVSLQKNGYVLGLWANDEYVKITSDDIAINANTAYKIKAYYKISELVSGSAYLLVSENDAVLENYNLLPKYYSVAAETTSSALNSNGSSEFINQYNYVEFYVKGGPLYNSSINISLALGSTSENATGAVVFDNVTIEQISSDDVGTTNVLTLGTISGSLSVSNGTFNNVSFDKETTYPLTAADWTITGSGSFTFAGVINTKQSEYEKYVALYNEKSLTLADSENPYLWASYYSSSPANSDGSTTSSDNVMMLANTHSAYQTLKSSNISLDANATTLLSFHFKTTAPINVKVYDTNGIKLYESGKITSGTWKQYEIYLKSAEGAASIYVEIDLGTEDDQTTGFAFFDNFEFKSGIDSAVFEAKQSSATGSENDFGVVDMTGYYLNLPTNDITTDLETSKTSAYDCAYGTGSSATNLGGVVSSDMFESSSIYHLDEESVVFYFENRTQGSYRIQSKYNFDLSSGYYALSFKVRTYFVKAESELDSKKTYNYGLTAGLTGFDYVKKIRCDDGYEEYTIYFHPTTSTSANLYFEFVSDCSDTLGTATIYDVTLTNGTDVETAYEEAQTKVAKKGYALNTDRVAVASVEDNQEENNENNEENSSTPAANNTLNWSLIISGVITAVAIILAVVLSLLKHIKIKKIEIKRKESYDRRASLEINVLKKRAEEEQKKQAKDAETDIKKLKEELNRLEKEHKAKVVELRENDKDKMSKTTDKEFKDFAKKRTVLAEKIDELNKKVEDIKSPEYLLSLERKLYAQDQEEKKALKKASKKK